MLLIDQVLASTAQNLAQPSNATSTAKGRSWSILTFDVDLEPILQFITFLWECLCALFSDSEPKGLKERVTVQTEAAPAGEQEQSLSELKSGPSQEAQKILEPTPLNFRELAERTSAGDLETQNKSQRQIPSSESLGLDNLASLDLATPAKLTDAPQPAPDATKVQEILALLGKAATLASASESINQYSKKEPLAISNFITEGRGIIKNLEEINAKLKLLTLEAGITQPALLLKKIRAIKNIIDTMAGLVKKAETQSKAKAEASVKKAETLISEFAPKTALNKDELREGMKAIEALQESNLEILAASLKEKIADQKLKLLTILQHEANNVVDEIREFLKENYPKLEEGQELLQLAKDLKEIMNENGIITSVGFCLPSLETKVRELIMPKIKPAPTY